MLNKWVPPPLFKGFPPNFSNEKLWNFWKSEKTLLWNMTAPSAGRSMEATHTFPPIACFICEQGRCMDKHTSATLYLELMLDELYDLQLVIHQTKHRRVDYNIPAELLLGVLWQKTSWESPPLPTCTSKSQHEKNKECGVPASSWPMVISSKIQTWHPGIRSNDLGFAKNFVVKPMLFSQEVLS